MAADLAARMRAQRQAWHELDAPHRRALLLERPSETRLLELRGSLTGAAGAMSMAREAIVGWRNFTEADLLGSVVGSDAPADCTPDVLDLWLSDQAQLLADVATVVVQMIETHALKGKDAEKK